MRRGIRFSSGLRFLALFALLPSCIALAEGPFPDAPHLLDTKFVPLPIFATEPTEGNTYGLMPVIMKVRHDTGATQAIYAPSLTWNAVIHMTGTFRYYYYPSDTQTLMLIPSVSTSVNWGLYALWLNLPREQGRWTDEDLLRVSRNVFFRFFGLGPDSQAGAQSSYTREWAWLSLRRGLNLGSDLNLAVKLDYRRDIVQEFTVPNLPASPAVFAGTPGMGGASAIGEEVELRYDTRMQGDYSERGFLARGAVGPYQGLAQSPDFGKFEFETKGLFEELPRLQGGARAYWMRVTSPGAPFYYQASLGGKYLMRGFTDDRFIDQNAWEAEFEQRIRLFQTRIYGVTTDWRIDPFVAVGQVYGNYGSIFENPRLSAGMGFRAWVRPNVLGRVDVADGGEGLSTYVEIGYPY